MPTSRHCAATRTSLPFSRPVDENKIRAHADQVCGLLALLEELHERLRANMPLDKQFLQTIWGASGELQARTRSFLAT